MRESTMYTNADSRRLYESPLSQNQENYHSAFYIDYARLIHSPAFRRLQGKTQLFPGSESDFFRNRLTHSIEVAQIGKSIANRVNWLLKKRGHKNCDVDTDLVQFACLAHDLGHPPFGHQGESALDEIMMDDGGFEGNAQTLRILTKLEKKEKLDGSDDYGIGDHGEDLRLGLNLCLRSLASIIKYDYDTPIQYKQRFEDVKRGKNPYKKTNPCKGYYHSELDIVNSIKKNLGVTGNQLPLKTVEMQIMDIADDIAYSVFDLEDSIKGKFINILDFTSSNPLLINVFKAIENALEQSQLEPESVIHELFNEVFLKIKVEDSAEFDFYNTENVPAFFASYIYDLSRDIADCGYARNSLTSKLIDRFINSVNIDFVKDTPAFSRVYIDNTGNANESKEKNIEFKIELLKRFTYEFQIQSSKLKIAESRGKYIIKTIFQEIEESEGVFLPNDYRQIYMNIAENITDVQQRRIRQKRTICDFIASMTDRYAVEFYGRLKSENPQSIFKSIH